MRAGKRDKSISIERRVENLDAYGVPREARAPIRTAKAAIIQASAEAFFGSGGIAAESIVVVRILSSEGVTPADRILHGVLVFSVKAINEIGRRRGREIRTWAKESGS
jgi:head-tail adaptor